MKLVQPTDFEILEALADGQRNNAVNVAELLDQERGYINTRLPQLADYGLVETVGPANNSGLSVNNLGVKPRCIRFDSFAKICIGYHSLQLLHYRFQTREPHL